MREQDKTTQVEATEATDNIENSETSVAESNKSNVSRKKQGNIRREQRKAEKLQLVQAQLEEDAQIVVHPVASSAKVRKRHWGVLLSFLLFVILPASGAFWYLNYVAADQYASSMGFSVSKEEGAPALELLGGISEITSGGTSDADILYEYIASQQMVTQIGERLDLRAIFSKPTDDILFAYQAPGSIEDLVDYWGRMVKVFYDGGNGLIQVRVHAFEAQDAQNIAQAIFMESSLLINRLSDIAREDATRHSKLELDLAVERLKTARQAVTAFRNEAQIVDPVADIQSQMGLLNTLQQQLAAALIELDLLKDTTRATDPRLEQANRKIVVIEARIADERKKFGVGDDGESSVYATLISDYEGLSVDREFAEQRYLLALTAFDGARSEAQKQSRYLAAYVKPTLAETPQYPKRLTIFGLVAMFLVMLWSIVILIYYSIKDRR